MVQCKPEICAKGISFVTRTVNAEEDRQTTLDNTRLATLLTLKGV